MKIVINEYYGDFSLSPKAVARLAELRGQTAYFFRDRFNGQPRVQVSAEEAKGFWVAYNTPTPTPPLSSDTMRNMSAEEYETYNKQICAEIINARGCDRSDPLLVQVVEELGEAANGKFAKLKIVEIPADVKWTIEEYEGKERVAEKHRVWR